MARMLVDTNITVMANLVPIVLRSDGVSPDVDVAYNEAGIKIWWNFMTKAGVCTTIEITPTTGGDYDWATTLANSAMYEIEIPATGGASANNDTEGFGYISGWTTAACPFRGPEIEFVSSAVANVLDGTNTMLAKMALAWGVVHQATAAAGAAGYVDLPAGANTNDDFYNGWTALLVENTGVGGVRAGTDYTGSTTRRLAIEPNWVTNPDNTTTVQLHPNAPATTTTLPSVVASSLGTQAKTDVNAEVSDVISVDTQTLPAQGAPTATPTIEEAIMYLYKFLRNRTTVTSSEVAVYADDGTTKDHEAAISDNGTTFDRGEFTTGA